MKKILFLLMVGILCLTACRGGQAPVSALPEPQTEASSPVPSDIPPQSERTAPVSEAAPSSSSSVAPSSSSSVASSSSTPPLLYNGEAVKSIYALDSNAYIMAKIDDSTRILSMLEEYEPGDSSPHNLGYLVFTEKSRTYTYLDDTNAALTKNCMAALGNAPLHPSWLIHMTPDRLVKANATTDKDTLMKLCSFLKEDVTVPAQSKGSASKGPANIDTVGGAFNIKLEFDSGVYYNIIGCDHFGDPGHFSIYASDLDTTVYYQSESVVSSKFRKYVEALK